MTLFLQGIFINKPGLVFREAGSGVGFVDLVVLLSTVAHLLELKILTNAFKGPAQLLNYMKLEKRDEGWLVVFDARAEAQKKAIAGVIKNGSRKINTLVVDINPVAPSRQK